MALIEDKKQIIESGLDASRIVSLSDGVFAFAATLLVTKIDAISFPSGINSNGFLAVLSQSWPQILSYIISFLVIGNYWIAHHRIFHYIKKFDMTLIWLNIFLLMFVAFLPFPSDLIGDHAEQEPAVLLYLGSLILTGLTQAGIWLYASYNRRLLDSSVDARVIEYYRIAGITPVIIMVLCILVSLLKPSYGLYTLCLLFLIRPVATRIYNR